MVRRPDTRHQTPPTVGASVVSAHSFAYGRRNGRRAHISLWNRLSFHVFALCSKINGDEQIPAVRASKRVDADAEESDA